MAHYLYHLQPKRIYSVRMRGDRVLQGWAPNFRKFGLLVCGQTNRHAISSILYKKKTSCWKLSLAWKLD